RVGEAALRTPARRGLLERELDAPKLGQHLASRLVIEPIDVEGAVHVVGLVLEDPSQQALTHYLHLPALHILTATSDLLGTGGGVIRTRDRQAALLFGELSLAVGELRVGDEQRAGLPVVEHEQAEGDADLGSGQTDAGRRVHRFDHVVAETPKRAVELGHGIRGLTQDRIAEGADGQDHGREPYRCGSASTRSTIPSAASCRIARPNPGTRSGASATRQIVRSSCRVTSDVKGACAAAASAT